MTHHRRTHQGGFTLIEVIIAIALLFAVVAAVFYFYSNLMDNQARFKEKYRVLRIAREFIDSLVNDPLGTVHEPGYQAIGDFVFRWTLQPVEREREVLYTSGLAPTAQLNHIHLRMQRKDTGRQVLELSFLVNVIAYRRR